MRLVTTIYPDKQDGAFAEVYVRDDALYYAVLYDCPDKAGISTVALPTSSDEAHDIAEDFVFKKNKEYQRAG